MLLPRLLRFTWCPAPQRDAWVSLKNELLSRKNTLYVAFDGLPTAWGDRARFGADARGEAGRYRGSSLISTTWADICWLLPIWCSRVPGASSVSRSLRRRAIGARAVSSLRRPTTKPQLLGICGRRQGRLLCADADIDSSAFADELLHLVDDAAALFDLRQAARGANRIGPPLFWPRCGKEVLR